MIPAWCNWLHWLHRGCGVAEDGAVEFGLASVACVCGRDHVVLTPQRSVAAWEQTCLVACPDRVDEDALEPCALCSLYWRQRLRRAVAHG